MLIAQIIVVIGDHLVRLALEAHALIAPTASNPVAPIYPDHWNLALVVRTLPHPVVQHVLLKQLVTALLGLLTRQPRVVLILTYTNSIPCTPDRSCPDRHRN